MRSRRRLRHDLSVSWPCSEARPRSWADCHNRRFRHGFIVCQAHGIGFHGEAVDLAVNGGEAHYLRVVHLVNTLRGDNGSQVGGYTLADHLLGIGQVDLEEVGTWLPATRAAKVSGL